MKVKMDPEHRLPGETDREVAGAEALVAVFHLHRMMRRYPDLIPFVKDYLFDEAPITMTAQPLSGGMVRSRKHRTMTAADRKRLSVAMKRRWAARKMAGKTSLGGK
jgi:hypothetical protein